MLCLRVIFRPTAAWQEIRHANPAWSGILQRQVLPLSLLPAIAWPVGTGQAFVPAFAATLAFAAISVLLLGAAFYALAAPFGLARSWNRSLAVAAYASTPVLLSGALLFLPILVIASVGALVHSLALCYLGVQLVIGSKEADADVFVACAFMLALACGVLLGALCSAAGWI